MMLVCAVCAVYDFPCANFQLFLDCSFAHLKLYTAYDSLYSSNLI